ncbi:hypothetical protein SETIT_2G080000v2 [Setaria italica]|uniref:F-box domain-containing protein n=1 Tax=Setaria italica TaxID=4555 RepID=K4A0Q7_SETIT|nr:hypothetical protein SETIT_2G080000v2 [Setaria italica]
MLSQRPTTRGDDGVLPPDALYEILLRVPAGPLCGFRAVCQSWRSLLSDPPFVAAHAARHRGDPLFAIAVAGGSHGETAEIKLLDTSGRVAKRVAAGPSALLRQMRPHLDLVFIRRLQPFGVQDVPPLRVLDPATGTVSLLPNDDGVCDRSYVFGRAATSTGGDGEYKVLSLCSCKILTVDGYHGRHGAWRTAPAPPVDDIETLHTGTVVAKGVVYLLVDNADGGWTMAAFDLEAEQWRPSLLRGPVAVPSIGDRTQRSLAEVNGRLAAVSSTVSTMDLWLLVGSGEQALWSERCRVLTSSVPRRREVYAYEEPLWVLDDGRVAFWACSYFARTGALWMYDPRTETCTRVAAMENCPKVGVGVYTGNLLRQVQRPHGMVLI